MFGVAQKLVVEAASFLSLLAGIIKGRHTTVKPHLGQFFLIVDILAHLCRLILSGIKIANLASRRAFGQGFALHGCAGCRWSSDHPPATYSTAEKIVQITASSITISETISR
jgi:hypothetical protein